MPDTERIDYAVHRVADVDSSLRWQMCALLQESYSNVSRDQFEKDLADKEWVITGVAENDRLVAFTTLRRIHIESNGTRIVGFYSGDTASSHSIRGRGTSLGIQCLLRTMINQSLLEPAGTMPYWFMISSTYRSYRLLSQLFLDYAPSPIRQPTHAERGIMIALSAAKGLDFDDSRSIVKLENPSIPLSDQSEAIARSSGDPAAVFFDQKNPGAFRGERLASLARLQFDNLTPLGKKFLAESGLQVT